MGIVVKTARGKQLDEKTFKKSLSDIAKSLKPGMPVMFLNYSKRDLIGHQRHAGRYLFISDGTLNREGVFGLQQGERNFIYAIANEKDPTKYQLINHCGKKLDNHRVSAPKNWTMSHYNEGTFSPSGGSSWLSFHSAGTEEIEIGEGLIKRFPDAFNALKFARDAVYFHLEQPYCTQGSLVRLTDESGKEMKRRELLINQISCVDAVLRLIKLSEMEIASYDGGVHANQVGRYQDEARSFRKNGYPVSDTDFVVNQVMHPCKAVAFVKAGEGTLYGETYILPTRKNDQVVERAFSKDLVKRIYPYGLG